MPTCKIVAAEVGRGFSVKRIGPQPEDTTGTPGPGFGHPRNAPPPPAPTEYQRLLGRFLRDYQAPPEPMQWEYDGFIGSTDGRGLILAPADAVAGKRLSIGAFVIDAVGNGECFEFNETSALEVLPPPTVEPLPPPMDP